jgi:hypothetical protein
MGTRWYALVVALVAAGCAPTAEDPSARMDEPLSADQQAIAGVVAALEKLGGRVTWEEAEDGVCDPEIEVSFFGKSIGDPELKEIIQELRKHEQFCYLDLSWTRVTDDGVKRLKDVPHLGTLLLSHTPVTDAALGDLGQVESLDLSFTGVTDLGVKKLESQQRLVWLSLDNTKVTGNALRGLRKALPGCTIKP